MAALIDYKCPCCGGGIEFDSQSQNMKCPFCDTEFEVDAIKEFNEVSQPVQDDFSWENPSAEWDDSEQQGMKVYSCENCGGQIVADETTSASACPYCDSPIVMSGQFEGGLKPDLIIPFKIDKKGAEEAFKNFLKGKFFLPSNFASNNRIEEIKGVYVPYWLFDCDADAKLRFKATKTRTWRSGDYEYTETKYYMIVRNGDIKFDKVPVDGSSKMPDNLSEAIEPFNYNDCKEFLPAYLAGYLSDKYDIDAETSQLRANERIKTSTLQEFKDTVKGYDSVISESVNIQLRSGKIRYALLPVWMLNTKYNGEMYNFSMNGQTGKFVGNLPTDWGKLWKLFAAITAGVGALAFVVQAFIL